MNALLSAIKPARTMNATLALLVVRKTFLFEIHFTYLLIDSLSAILALDGMLDNRIMRKHSIGQSQPIQRKSDHDKIDDLIHKCSITQTLALSYGGIIKVSSPIRHDDRPIISRLLGRIVLGRFIEVGPRLKDGELLIHVLVQGEDDGDGRHENVVDKRFDHVGKRSSETTCN